MDLQGPTDEYSRATTAPLVSARGGRIPEAVPSRLTGQELEAMEAGPEVAVFLQEQNHTGLVQGMEDGSTTAPDIKGGDEVRHGAPQMRWPETDQGGATGRRGVSGGRDTRPVLNGRGPRGVCRFRQRVLRPHIVMAHRGCGIPKVAWGPHTYGLDTKGGMNMYADIVHSRRSGDL